MSRRRKKGRDVSGWLVLDKPVGLTSTQAVSAIKRRFDAKKAGHAGTLDPLASGCLPIALGEATKTVSFVMHGRKIYQFTVRWGEETNTDDSDGDIVDQSDHRPELSEIESILPEFTGEIAQVPPRFSAIKIDGERAYDLAREGVDVTLHSRPVTIHCLRMIDAPNRDTAIFEAECGKGTYVRSLARDMGRRLDTFGHVTALRRLLVGPFDEEAMISLDELDAMRHGAPSDEDSLDAALMPIETALDDIPALAINRSDAARLKRGQAVLLRGRDAPTFQGSVYAMSDGVLVAIGELERGAIHPKRVFNLTAD